MFHDDNQPDGDEHDADARLKRAVVASFSIAMTTPSTAIQTTFIDADREHQQHHRPAAAEAVKPLPQAERNTPRGSDVQLAKKNGTDAGTASGRRA